MRQAIRLVKSRRFFWLACLFTYTLCVWPVAAERATPAIVCRAGLTQSRRLELSAQLRVITGWSDLSFDGEGALRFGATPPSGGSASARALLTSAREGKKLIVIEDVSGSDDVAFARVLAGQWKGGEQGRPPAYVLQLDFTDFSHVMGDEDARASFNAGWSALHEIEHVVHDSFDPDTPGKTGECEERINRMRRECGLAERAEYFYTPLPGAQGGDFKTRYVRLAFERVRADSKRRRYWLFWDAELTGGMPSVNQVASK